MRYHLFLLYLLCFPFCLGLAQTEKEYSDHLKKYFKGDREKRVYGGRIDIVTDKFAIEVERAFKWKNAIGQSLWYGQQGRKQPGIIIITEKASDYKYVQMLSSSLAYAGLADKVILWEYRVWEGLLIDGKKQKIDIGELSKASIIPRDPE